MMGMPRSAKLRTARDHASTASRAYASDLREAASSGRVPGMTTKRGHLHAISKARSCLGALALAVLGGCASPTAGISTGSPTSPPPAAPSTAVPDNAISEIAQREIVRRQERIRQMDEAAMGASRALSENDLEGAVSGFREASR